MIVLWIGLAFLLGMLFSQIKLPPLVGYLVAGALLAANGVVATDALHEIAHLGVLFLLFTVGLHLRVKNIIRAEVLGVGGIHLLISTAIFTPIAYLLGYSLLASTVIAIMLGFSSTVLTAKNLERRNELGSFHGRVAIGILILQDVVAIAILGFASGTTPSPWALGLLGLPLLRPAIVKTLQFSQEEELKLLLALLLAIGGGSLFEMVGLSSELGALAAGMLLSGNKMGDVLADKLWGLKEAFLVGFFLEVGLAGTPGVDELYLIVIVLAVLPIKSILFFGLMILFRLRARTSFVATISLSSYSEFTLIAGSVAASAGMLPQGAIIALALITAISFALNAPVTIWEERIWQRLEQRLLGFEREVRHPDDKAMTLGAAEYLVVGVGRAGQAAYDRLKNDGFPVAGIDFDPGRVESNLAVGRRVLYGDTLDPELWKELGTEKLKAIMIAVGSTETKLQTTELARKFGFDGQINVLTTSGQEQGELRKAGANAVCLPITQAGRKLAEMSVGTVDDFNDLEVAVDSASPTDTNGSANVAPSSV